MIDTKLIQAVTKANIPLASTLIFGKLAEYCKCGYESRREFILDTLVSIGLSPRTQEWSYDGTRLMNIFALYGAQTGRKFPSFSAHYDKTPEGDGILDNGAAVIELLSALEHMVKEAMPGNFGFIFFDGEEKGLVGSRKYVHDMPLYVSQVYNLEVTGRGDSVLIGSKSISGPNNEYTKNSKLMNNRIQKVCERLEIPFFYAGTPPSDNVILNKAGIKSTVFSTVSKATGEIWAAEGAPTQKVWDLLDINGKNDTLDKIQPETLCMVENIILGIAELTPKKP
jgi:hypothetical protein